MKIYNFNRDTNSIPDIIRTSIVYIIKHHSKIDFGVFYLPETDLKVIKLNYMTASLQEEYVYESHRKVDDVHFVFSGDESVSVAQKSECELTNEYNEQDDYSLYRSAHFQKINLKESDIIIFSPADIHSTGIKNESSSVIKYVIKLPFDAI